MVNIRPPGHRDENEEQQVALEAVLQSLIIPQIALRNRVLLKFLYVLLLVLDQEGS